MNDEQGYRIVGLRATNFMRLKAIDLTPPEDLVVVGGRNGQGKTSVLEAIHAMLAGARAEPPEPVRRGADRAEGRLDLGDLVVHYSRAAGGARSIRVEAKDGSRYSRPQEVLDALTTPHCFDPVAFSRLGPAQQRDVLLGLAGDEVAALDDERAAAYEERTAVSRVVRSLQAQLEGMPEHPDAPAEPEDVAALLLELDRLSGVARESEDLARRKQDLEQDVKKLDYEMEALRQQLAELQADREEAAEGLASCLEEAAGRPDVSGDVASLKERLAASQEVNRLVEANARRRDTEGALREHVEQIEELGATIERIDRAKADALRRLLSIEGLSWDDGGLLWEGLHFEQAAASVKLMVGVKVGLALNPRFRVLLVRDGSLLDDENFEALRGLAREHRCQLWIEQVTRGTKPDDRVTVLIEDGQATWTREAER